MPSRRESGQDQGLAALGDDVLIARVAGADRAAFTALFRRYAPKVKSYLLSLRLAPARADDVVQDIMVTLWRKAGAYDASKAGVSTWIFTIARNKFIDSVRRERRPEVEMDPETDRADDAPSADRILGQGQDAQALSAALEELPPDQYRVVAMAFLEDMSHSEIAATLDLPLGTVKSRIRLAMSRLRLQLESLR